MFVMLRLLGGMQTSVERCITDGKEAEHSPTAECSDENQHNVWNPFLLVGEIISLALKRHRRQLLPFCRDVECELTLL